MTRWKFLVVVCIFIIVGSVWLPNLRQNHRPNTVSNQRSEITLKRKPASCQCPLFADRRRSNSWHTTKAVAMKLKPYRSDAVLEARNDTHMAIREAGLQDDTHQRVRKSDRALSGGISQRVRQQRNRGRCLKVYEFVKMFTSVEGAYSNEAQNCPSGKSAPKRSASSERIVSSDKLIRFSGPEKMTDLPTGVTQHLTDEYEERCSLEAFRLKLRNSSRAHFLNKFGLDSSYVSCTNGIYDSTECRKLNLYLVSVCITFAVLGSPEVRKILSRSKALPSASILRELVKALEQGRCLISSKMDKYSPTEMQNPSYALLSSVHTMLSNYLSPKVNASSKTCQTVLDPVPRRESTKQKPTSGTVWAKGFFPRPPAVYTVYPATFLPTTESSFQDMSFAGFRLASLNSLPASCNVSRIRLAQAGFYYDNSNKTRDSKNMHELVCYSCGVRISEWKNGDNPAMIHQRRNPNCPHVVNSSNTSPSYPMTHLPDDSASSSMSSSPRSSLSSGYGSMSLSSSEGSSMAQGSMSGFNQGSHFSNTTTTCDGATGGSHGRDLETDCSAILPSASVSSKQMTSNPPTARDTTTPPQFNQNRFLSSRDIGQAWLQDLEDRPPLSMDKAVYPQFSRHLERRATFSNWPWTTHFHPDDLVWQGFYYAGYADCIRCFYCGVGLKSWAENDDVMVEHIRWRPSCGYVLNTKGRRFVNRIMEQIQVQSNGTRDNHNQSHSANNGSEMATASTTTTTATAFAAGTSSVSPQVLETVEGMGFSMNSIAKAVLELQQSGMSAIDANALTEKLLEMPTTNDTSTLEAKNASAPAPLDTRLYTDGPEAVPVVNLPEADQERAKWLLKENERLKSQQACKVCHKAKVGIIFMPCGHVVACAACGSEVKKCVLCNKFIRATANVYMS